MGTATAADRPRILTPRFILSVLIALGITTLVYWYITEPTLVETTVFAVTFGIFYSAGIYLFLRSRSR